jgi:N-methylhydantoinase B
MDGQEGGPYCIANLANVPCELIEAENPVLVEEYAFLPDTGGAGKYRGALGVTRQYRMLAEETTVNLRSDRHLHPCWGLFGGAPGSLSRSIINPGTDHCEAAPSKFLRTMLKGEVFRGEFGGSGGYGDPLERDLSAVAEDFRQEKITVTHALDAYGVVIDPVTLRIDVEATRLHRARRSTQNKTSAK